MKLKDLKIGHYDKVSILLVILDKINNSILNIYPHNDKLDIVLKFLDENDIIYIHKEQKGFIEIKIAKNKDNLNKEIKDYNSLVIETTNLITFQKDSEKSKDIYKKQNIEDILNNIEAIKNFDLDTFKEIESNYTL